MKSLFRGRVLSNAQLRLYQEKGFLQVSGLIRRDVAEHACQTLLRRDGHPATGPHHEFVRDPAVVSCFTRMLRSAAAELAGASAAFETPSTVYTIHVFPTNSLWHWPAPHLDHAHDADAYTTFPPPFRIGCLVYLNDTPPRSGGTVVWPGSHRKLKELARVHSKKYEYMASLNRDIQSVALTPPVEITPCAGDVLFYHYLLAHAGSMNTGSRPRVALNHKW
jgi:ectoine hydroxylase-related dioxygenase (phytanoyl-CoA dioxygenase family)